MLLWRTLRLPFRFCLSLSSTLRLICSKDRTEHKPEEQADADGRQQRPELKEDINVFHIISPAGTEWFHERPARSEP